jgi:hypothetical protein
MSTPLATIFEGDVTLEAGSDITQYGYGDLRVRRKVIISGTEDSTGSISQGSLLVDGGVLIRQNLHSQKDVNVLYGVTNLTETHIDTTNGPTTVTGGNAVSISVGAASQFVSTGGNLSLGASSQSVNVYGGLNGSAAVNIYATSTGGGVRMLSGVSGDVSIIAGSGGLLGYTSSGNLNLSCNNASGSFNVNSISDNQNLVIGVYGNTDSQLVLESSGVNSSRTAIVLNSTNTSGSIQISNASGLGSGGVSLFAGSGGFNAITNTGGNINVRSQGAGSTYAVSSASSNQNLSIRLDGDTDSTLLIQSSGNNNTHSALQIVTTHTNGNIVLNQPASSAGGISARTGTGGFTTTTQTGGSISMTAYGAVSDYTNATTSDNQHLYVRVTGDTNSKVIISSTGTGTDAIRMETTNGTGGVFISSVGGIQLQSSDSVNGVKIATSTPVPLTIGTPTSVTTILGDLYVRGNTSSVDQQVVTVDDNIIVVNNAPYGTSDGGLAIKRYQAANNSGLGDVVIDTPEESGTVQNTGNTVLTVTLASTSSNLNDYYNGWWIRILSGTGAGQVRRIKSYNGTSKVANVYSTAEQSGILNNPQPVEGMDFVTIPDNTSTYGLYPCHYVMNIWDESNNEFALICSATNPSDPNNPSFEPNISHYSDLHINNLQSNGIYANTINDSVADITTTVVLNDNSSTPVTIPNFPQNYGIYTIYVKPLTNNLRTHAIFNIGRINVNTLPGQVVRLMGIKGAQNEQLMIQWNADSMPQLFYRPAPGSISSTTYKIKIVSL